MEGILFLLIALLAFSVGYLVLEVSYLLFCMFVLYPIYKIDGGKMKLRKYLKCMML